MITRGTSDPGGIEREVVPPDGRPASEQPKWRQDFPIDWPVDEYVSRRDLVKFVVLTSAAMAAGQFWILSKGAPAAAEASEPLRIADVGELPVGQAKTFFYPAGSTPRILVRTGAAEFVAYDQLCTHLLCPVVPAFDAKRLHCPCHNGWFDIATGRPVAGPPRRALDRVRLDVRDGGVWAVGVEKASA